MTSPSPTAAAPVVPRRMALAVLGLLCSLAALPLHLVLMDVPLLARTGLVSWIMLGAGALLGLLAARRDRRWPVLTLAGVSTFLLLGGVISWFVLARLPAPQGPPSANQIAPDFTLSDHTGKPVTLKDQIAAGPVLLVFYRGFW